MPPKGSRMVKEDQDSRSEGSSSNLKQQSAGATRGKRAVATTNGNNTSHLLDTLNANDSSSNQAASTGSNAFSWPQEPLALLQSYRSAHHLATPSAFSNQRNQYLLTNPGIGRQSPTMCRKKQKRKVGKEQLALAVRKNFNAAAVSEVEVMVGLLYKVRHQDKAFRMRAAPTKPTKNNANGQ
ncbi:hypothetical protein BDV97DRAFT_363992 [Delphinella strobiligena]|nr:hypothetical protein BDV97DRAFT_363992 [Delphinella strobiligena]